MSDQPNSAQDGSTNGQLNELIDAHCHLSDYRLFHRIDEALAAARSRGIHGFIQGGIHPADWDLQLELQERFPGAVYPCFGLHPWLVAGRMGVTGEELKLQIRHGLEVLPEYLSRPGVVAVGELGIDLGPKTDPTTEAFQKEIFIEQLKVARQAGKPLVLHIVKAHSEAIRLLKEHGPWPRGGLVHAFASSYEIGQEYVQQGFTLSLGGVLARKGYETLKRSMKRVSLDQIVIESDSPDQIPDQFHGFEEGTNDPRSLWIVAEELCRLRGEPGLTPEAVLKKSRENLIRIFGLELAAPSL